MVEAISSQPSTSFLKLKRIIGQTRKSAVLKCIPATITILSDQIGNILSEYTDCFNGKTKNNTVILDYQGNIDCQEFIHLVGFNEELPEISIPDYLRKHNLSDSKIEYYLNRFELSSELYLMCSQLSQTDTRKLLLITAVESLSPIIVLNDPFQPFSGRWREDFGEVLFEDCVNKKRIYICTNISFVPNSWLGKPNVCAYDVGVLAEKAIKRADELATKKQQEAINKNQTDLNGNLDPNLINVNLPVPNSFMWAGNSVAQRVFKTLAYVGDRLRGISSTMFFVSFTIVAVLAVTILSYDVGGSRQKLKDLMAKIQGHKLETKSTEENQTPQDKNLQPNASSEEENINSQLEEESLIEKSPLDISLLKYVLKELKIPEEVLICKK